MNQPHLRDTLHDMVAVLEAERAALAALDLDGITGAAQDKALLCGRIEEHAALALDPECRGLADAARRLNEVNRQVRNLVAANVAARLDALTGWNGVAAAPAYAGMRSHR